MSFDGYVEYKDVIFTTNTMIIYAAIYPLCSNLLCFYIYCCLRSYADMRDIPEMFADPLGLGQKGAQTIVYEQVPQ